MGVNGERKFDVRRTVGNNSKEEDFTAVAELNPFYEKSHDATSYIKGEVRMHFSVVSVPAPDRSIIAYPDQDASIEP